MRVRVRVRIRVRVRVELSSESIACRSLPSLCSAASSALHCRVSCCVCASYACLG